MKSENGTVYRLNERDIEYILRSFENSVMLMDSRMEFEHIKPKLPHIKVDKVSEFLKIIEEPFIYIIEDNKLYKMEILAYDSIDLKIYINDITSTNLSRSNVRNILRVHLPSHL